MPSARGNRDDDMSEYEKLKWARVERNNEVIESLHLRHLSTELQRSQPNKRTKRTHNPGDAAIGHHNLRPRPQRDNVEIANEQTAAHDSDYEVVGEFLCDNQDLHTKKRNGRKITTMNDIFSRKPDMPKIKIITNDLGQPVGENYRKFASAIGCEVRKTLPVRFTDWRDVPYNIKDKVWTSLQAYFDYDEAVNKWFTDTSAKKWKDYKTFLKKKYFDETSTDEQMKERLKNILNVDDINGLIDFWRSPECQARSERGKANRAKLTVHHTSGTISYACRSYNMGKSLGRLARRDEVFVSTHTKKNGVPLREAAETIDKLKAIVEAHPELKDKTIQEGDVYAAVCGAKEPRGRVRVLGLGPTPQEIGTPGLKGLMSTRLQAEIWGRKRAESKNIALEQRIRELEEERIAQGRTNVDVLSHHGSNSRQYASPTPEGPIDEAHNASPLEEQDNYYVENEYYDRYEEDDENLLPHRHAPARSALNITTATNVRPRFPNDAHVEMQESLPPSRPIVAQSARNITTAPASYIPRLQDDFANETHVATEEILLPPRPAAAQSAKNLTTAPTNDMPPRFANNTHVGTDKSFLPHTHDAAHPPINKTTTATNNVPRLHDDLVGKDVILYAILRSESPVARGTVISTNPNTIVGGQPLGNEYCKVVVNVVMKREAMLPRSYGEMLSMASALNMNIAWPFNKVKECKKREGKKAS